MTPRVTVVVPAYDAASYVGAAIESVRAQTFEDWELVVVDDGSMDATVEVARAAAQDDERVRVLTIAHSGLPAVARNHGIDVARGAEIALLDADDTWLPSKLERQLTVFDRDPLVGLVHCAAIRSDRSAPPHQEVRFDLLARAHNPIYTSSVLIRRSVLERYGAFDPDPRLRGTEDFELWLRLSGQVAFEFVDEPLLRYTVRPGSVGSDQSAMAAGGLAAIEKSIAREPDRFAALGSRYLTWVGAQRFRSELGDLGRRELRTAVALDRRNVRALGWLTLATLRVAWAKRVVRAVRGVTGIATTRR